MTPESANIINSAPISRCCSSINKAFSLWCFWFLPFTSNLVSKKLLKTQLPKSEIFPPAGRGGKLPSLCSRSAPDIPAKNIEASIRSTRPVSARVPRDPSRAYTGVTVCWDTAAWYLGPRGRWEGWHWKKCISFNGIHLISHKQRQISCNLQQISQTDSQPCKQDNCSIRCWVEDFHRPTWGPTIPKNPQHPMFQEVQQTR